MDNNQSGKKEDPQLKALNILINGIKVAQKRGAYELQEAELLWNAIKTFLVDENNENSGNNIDSLNENLSLNSK